MKCWEYQVCYLMKGRKDLCRLKLYSNFLKGRLQLKYPGILPIEVEKILVTVSLQHLDSVLNV